MGSEDGGSPPDSGYSRPMRCHALGLALALLLCSPAQASDLHPLVPAIGDTYTYSVSTGERVTLETIRVHQLGDHLVATDRELIRKKGQADRTASVDVIRTDDALAFAVSSQGDSAITPLVFFFGQANQDDSWLAQRGSYIGPSGVGVNYQILARVAALETVTVPAGTFPESWKVIFTTTRDASKHLTVWLRPDLGILRTQSNDRGQNLVTELVGYDLKAQVE
ncbi:MAG: hypothetical protein KGR26_02200 [Cyanobacteria bacterium REEB65]|nr:hypothetical protein [Cyanobacteria bacterium REEB65]